VIEPTAQAFSPFPQTSVRLKALHEEIADVLPRRDAQVTASPEFEEFKKRIRDWKPAGPMPTPNEEKP